jgi:endoglycosylceramidase
VADPHEPPRGDNLNRGKLRVSSRPYPRAVAGTPESFGFDDETGTFELTYSTEGPDGERLPRRLLTEVFVPRIHYRGGYGAQADGARVVSKPGARILKLKRARGADEVSLTVTG